MISSGIFCGLLKISICWLVLTCLYLVVADTQQLAYVSGKPPYAPCAFLCVLERECPICSPLTIGLSASFSFFSPHFFLLPMKIATLRKEALSADADSPVNKCLF